MTSLDHQEKSVLNILESYGINEPTNDLTPDVELFKISQWKCSNNISNRKYNALRKVNLQNNALQKLPKLHHIQQLHQRLANETPVFRNEKGTYVNGQDKITRVLNNRLKENPRKFEKKLRKKIVKIKLSGKLLFFKEF